MCTGAGSNILLHFYFLSPGMVSVLDESVGKVTKALHERGMLQNSIIVFSTDNGGPCQSPYIANNAPLR